MGINKWNKYNLAYNNRLNTCDKRIIWTLNLLRIILLILINNHIWCIFSCAYAFCTWLWRPRPWMEDVIFCLMPTRSYYLFKPAASTVPRTRTLHHTLPLSHTSVPEIVRCNLHSGRVLSSACQYVLYLSHDITVSGISKELNF